MYKSTLNIGSFFRMFSDFQGVIIISSKQRWPQKVSDSFIINFEVAAIQIIEKSDICTNEHQ